MTIRNPGGLLGSYIDNPIEDDGVFNLREQFNYLQSDNWYKTLNIVRDGLILFLDAADTFSYPGTGTIWYDLSGNNNHHDLVSAPTWSSGKFTLNGSTQGFQKLNGITGVTTTCTVSLWYSSTDTQELWVRGQQNDSWYLSASSGNNYYHSNCGTPTNFVDLLTVVNPATPINYRNGIFRMWEAKNVNFSSWTQFQWFLYGSGWQLAGDVSIIMIYNKSLSAEESSQNFNAFRSRYGR